MSNQGFSGEGEASQRKKRRHSGKEGKWTSNREMIFQEGI